MKCKHCGFENEPDARFCENCGEALEQSCPNCGQAVRAGAKFCKHCGFKLAQSTPATATPAPANEQDRLLLLHQAAPQELAEKIRAQRGRQAGERKRVTALFTDIVGSTALAEQMDPEDWRDIVTGAHQCVSEVVYRYEGTIAQLLGDGVLSFFGAPIAHEDDPERAIRAALDILAAIQAYEKKLTATHRLKAFQMRAGLNTGLVVAGNIGSDLHMEYLAVGDTINLAARLQSAADPNTAFVSHATQRLAASLFEYEDRGRIEVKGKAELVQVYRVLQERKGASRARGIAGLSSPLVGRARELGLLTQVLEGLRGGQGGIVRIVGDAGLGKSRLTAEWRKLAAESDPPIRWVEGRCLSFTTTSAHHLSTDMLRAMCSMPAGAADAETEASLKACLKKWPALDFDACYPYLAHLLNVKLDEPMAAQVRHLDGPALMMRYATALHDFIRAIAQSQPLLILCEDVHWADPSSVELLTRVLPVAGEAPVVFAFVTRPEHGVPGWKLAINANEIAQVGAIDIRLAPLSDADSKQLVSNLLEVEALPEKMRQLILAKAEGNPFFVEEVIRMLIDHGGIARSADTGNWVVTGDLQHIAIPDTLHGVLTARIDRLPEDVKRTLQVAAVIGRRFQVKVLERVLREL
jgi:class 3 adenylate cyclase